MGFSERCTQNAQHALALSQESAKAMGHNYVGSEHLLLGLIKVEDCSAARALAAIKVTEAAVQARADELVGRGDYHFTDSFGYTPRTKKILELSLYEARSLKSSFVGTEHILLALLREKDSVAVRILNDIGTDFDLLHSLLAGSAAPDKKHEPIHKQSSTPTLDLYGRDLTRLAEEGLLDPVIGREKETERILQILTRRTKNNPVLIGDPGVGKSAVIEGLAQLIASGRIPELLQDKRVFTIDMGSMISGTKYRGEFEERLTSAIDELRREGNTIVFIDELHSIIGAGSTEGSIDAANILKPALARGEIQVIGATTPDEYRRYIEKDAALERRFQPVSIGEPSKEETYRILLGLREKYENHHKTRISDEALKAAVELSSRYIPDRFLPDKAIDLMDEAASRVRLREYTTPNDVRDLKARLEMLQAEKEQAVSNQNYERAAAIRDEEQKLRHDIDDIHACWELQHDSRFFTVKPDDVADVVSAWTGIPVSRLTESESERLLRLEELLHERVIGQNGAVSAVAKSIRRARAGLRNHDRPIGSFIFMGPTGVGKTELSKALAQAMFSDESALIRLDMSEYMEGHSASKLIGSPPGYVGYDDGGQLTEKVRRKPYSVILLDELEKAHPDVLNILLQILDDGRLTDSRGRTVDFRNTVIIMTSNIGSKRPGHTGVMGFGASDPDDAKKHEEIMSELKHRFSPEFINRVDEIIPFNPLTPDEIGKISSLMLKELTLRLSEKGISITVTPEAGAFLAAEGFDSQYGARPLRRAIRRHIEDKLSEGLLSGNIVQGDNVRIEVANGETVLIADAEKQQKG